MFLLLWIRNLSIEFIMVDELVKTRISSSKFLKVTKNAINFTIQATRVWNALDNLWKTLVLYILPKNFKAEVFSKTSQFLFSVFLRWYYYDRVVPRKSNYDRQVPEAFRMLQF